MTGAHVQSIDLGDGCAKFTEFAVVIFSHTLFVVEEPESVGEYGAVSDVYGDRVRRVFQSSVVV